LLGSSKHIVKVTYAPWRFHICKELSNL
jgi:hypothetical protein